jgi:hypothetical protein
MPGRWTAADPLKFAIRNNISVFRDADIVSNPLAQVYSIQQICGFETEYHRVLKHHMGVFKTLFIYR